MKTLFFVITVALAILFVSCKIGNKNKNKENTIFTNIPKEFLAGTIYEKNAPSVYYIFESKNDEMSLILSPSMDCETSSMNIIPADIIIKFANVVKEISKDSSVNFLPNKNGNFQTKFFGLSEKDYMVVVAQMIINNIQKTTGWTIAQGLGGIYSKMVTIPAGGSLCGTLNMTPEDAHLFAKRYGYKEIGKDIVIVYVGERFVQKKDTTWEPAI